MKTRRFYRGATTAVKPAVAATPSPKAPTAQQLSSAYVLAMANIQKSWARRWLRCNGFTTFVVLLTLVSLAQASVPVARFSSSAVAHATEEAAVRAVLTTIADKAQEYCGIVIEYKGVYVTTEPVTQGSVVKCDFEAPQPQGARLVATYHNHPCDPQQSGFSAQDLRQAKKMRIRAYLAYCGVVDAYDPTTREVTRL